MIAKIIYTIRFENILKLDCIGKCRAMIFHDHFKIWTAAHLSDDQTSKLILRNMLAQSLENKTFNPEVVHKCKERCGSQSECFSEYYRFEQIVYEYPKENFEIHVSPPRVPDLVYRHSPKLKFVEFCCFIASIISLWFGFSLIMRIYFQ